MIPTALHQFLQTDLMPMLACSLAAVACGVLGNFLVLRRMSLMGDAISHAVLPGLVLAFIITQSRATWPMLLGAALSGLLTVGLVSLVRRLGRLDPGTAMGVVFTVLFALGVLMIERVARQVDLDPECVLYGMAETLFWLDPPRQWADLLSPASLAGIPRQVTTLAVMAVLALGFVALLFKELRIAAFDPALATSLGFPAPWINALLMAMVAAATVASFEAVGSILVVAMLVCPAATARLLTDRLRSQVIASVLIALASGILGYILGALAPAWIADARSLSVTGMMTVVAGTLLALAAVFSPSHGVLARRIRHLALAVSVAREDLLAALYRARERSGAPGPADAAIPTGLVGALARRQAVRRRELAPGAPLALTDAGLDAARQIVRTHRLWERYLVDQLGLRPDHVHDTAMRVEHLRQADLAPLAPLPADHPDAPALDPHGSPIPSPAPPTHR